MRSLHIHSSPQQWRRLFIVCNNIFYFFLFRHLIFYYIFYLITCQKPWTDLLNRDVEEVEDAEVVVGIFVVVVVAVVEVDGVVVILSEVVEEVVEVVEEVVEEEVEESVVAASSIVSICIRRI